jgi:hypothetical protein
VKTQQRFIVDLIDTWLMGSSLLLPVKEANGKEKDCPDITLYLSALKQRPKFENNKNKKGFWFPSLEKKYKKGVFLLRTRYGSYIKTCIRKRWARGKIYRDDFCLFSFLSVWLGICILLIFRVKLHAASVLNEKGLSIFLGANGVGKSFISSLLHLTGGARVMSDDETFILSTFKGIKAFFLKSVLGDYFISTPRWLFFVERDKSKRTKVLPITKKDALKRIVFHSEFPKSEEMHQNQKRLQILQKLVDKCRCYVLINGKDLKGDPDKMKELLSLTWKEVRK